MINASMEMSEIIKCRLTACLAPEQLSIINESHQHAGHHGSPGTGNSHFAVTIVSAQFSNKTLKQRHLMVYEALNGLIGKEIHALRITALSIEESI